MHRLRTNSKIQMSTVMLKKKRMTMRRILKMRRKMMKNQLMKMPYLIQ